MTNLIYQGKIIRHFWGKLIRQSTIRHFPKTSGLQNVTWGGAVLVNISNNITFFHSVKRIE